MSNSSSQQSARTAAHAARRGARPRNGYPVAPGESTGQREWDELVAREAIHQEVIEASFDRAEAYERLGDFDRALEWLDRAAELGGGLPPAFRARRARWARATRRPRPMAGGWRNPLDGPGQAEVAP
jgi:tetratricopeptide (TPR) repeat protein